MAIAIVDYDPRWVEQFERVEREIKAALGELVVAVEHVGSTAVPGLAAKPILDVDVVIESMDVLPAVIARMAAMGYEHQGDLGIAGRRAFKAPVDEVPRHVYVCVQEARALREHLAFRDYLRGHAETANAYGKLKREIAAELGGDRAGYTDRKTAFVREVLARGVAGAEF